MQECSCGNGGTEGRTNAKRMNAKTRERRAIPEPSGSVFSVASVVEP